jgi:hypothetical protein
MWVLMPLYVIFDCTLISNGRETRLIVWLAVGYGLVAMQGVAVLQPLAPNALQDVWLLRMLLSQSFFGAVILTVLALRLRLRLSSA